MFRLKKFGHLLILLLTICLICSQTSLLSQEKSQQEEEKKVDELFKLSLEELMKIKIKTAGKTEEKIADIPASVVLITREDIEAYGYRTLTEILENIPGLYSIDDYTDNFSNFGVRGFWSGVANDNIIILVDGVHQVNDMFSNYPLNKITVPVEAIDRIEVIRGPMSVIYGNGAFYGVINIFTNEDSDKPVSIVGSSAGSEKTKKLFLRLEDNKDDFNYVLNASIYDTYGLDIPLSDTVKDPSTLLFLGVPEDYKTGGKFKNNEKYFNLSGSFKHFFLNLSHNVSKRDFIAYFPSPPEANGTYIRSTTTFISLVYRNEISDKITIEGKLNYSQNRDSLKFEYFFEDFYGNQFFETEGYEVEFNAFFKPSEYLDIATGLYYRAVLNVSDMIDVPSFGIPDLENYHIYLSDDDNIVTQAAFTQITYSPFDSLRLVAGVRLEQTPKYGLEKIQVIKDPELGPITTKLSAVFENEKIEIIPRFAAIYYLNDQNIFKFLYGKAINRPSFFQNSKNSLDPLREDLKPESIQTLEFNYITSISSKLNLNLSIFHNTLNNLITRIFILDPEGNYESYSGNAGKMVTNGIELTLIAKLFKNFRFEFSGIYQHTKDKRVGYENIDVSYSPKFLGYFKALYRTEKFSLAVTGNYVDAMETFWDETIGTSGARIGDKVAEYFILGANLRIENLLLEGVYLNIRCSNLLNEKIRYPNFTGNSWATRGTIGYGRTFLVGLGYKF